MIHDGSCLVSRVSMAGYFEYIGRFEAMLNTKWITHQVFVVATIFVPYLCSTEVNMERIAKSFRVGGKSVERRLHRITLISIDEGTIQLARALPYIAVPFSFIHPSFQKLRLKRVRAVRSECRRVRSSAEEYEITRLGRMTNHSLKLLHFCTSGLLHFLQILHLLDLLHCPKENFCFPRVTSHSPHMFMYIKRTSCIL
jgi:hypothetical protein